SLTTISGVTTSYQGSASLQPTPQVIHKYDGQATHTFFGQITCTITGPSGVRPVGYRCRWSTNGGDCLVCVQREGVDKPNCYRAQGTITRVGDTLPKKVAAPTTHRSSEIRPPPPGRFLFSPLTVEFLVDLS
ncbi:MAG TPA: hypothetical protein VIJ88_01915, partial [Candidatus Paceibacterota bacterium]